MRVGAFLLFFMVAIFASLDVRKDSAADALAPAPMAPLMGIGALLFRPRNVKIVKSNGEEDLLAEAGKFFVDAFWTNKIGGAKTLSVNQQASLEKQQITEFKKRYRTSLVGSGRLPGSYSGRSLDSRAELVVCLTNNGECIGCAGVEVDSINDPNTAGSSFVGPLMSNLAVGRRYRRKGLAEDLVRSTENIARKEWGFNECYLLVEKRNTPAIKLYRKLGYNRVWENESGNTLLPTDDGRVINKKTTIVCMKKKLGVGFWENLTG